MDDLWREVTCSGCSGSGVAHGTEPPPDECRPCGGSGRVFLRPSGHAFAYPGGLALGIWGKSFYEKGQPVEPWTPEEGDE